MSRDIEAVVNIKEIESKNVEVGEWGLNFKGQLTTEEWLDVALSIQKFDGKIQWYLGDLAVYAESDVTGWDKKKEDGKSKYDDLINATGYDRKTFTDYATAARRFTPLWREEFTKDNPLRNGLSFNHFRAVITLDDNFAGYWLDKAGNNAWGVAKLREEIRKWKEGRGKIIEREEKPIGIVTYKQLHDDFIRRYPPTHPEKEYDEVTYLLEVYDAAKERLHQLGIEVE